jgi:hypothetical protein
MLAFEAGLEPPWADPTELGPMDGRLADLLINCFLIPSLKALSAALSCESSVPLVTRSWGKQRGGTTYAAPLGAFLTPSKAFDSEAVAFATCTSFIRGFITTLLADTAGPATSSESGGRC